MRTALVETLVEMADADDRIFLLTADLGFSVVERFAQRHPRRFVNVGVAEQNMIGIATGLAQLGFMPFCYSIATFASMRGYEQVRNGPVLHRLPVRVIGIGGGFAYGHAGPTHFALEDLVIMRAQPGMTVLAPADPAQTRAAARTLTDLKGPAYLRVGKGGNPEVPGLGGRFALDRPEIVRAGRDLLFITTGEIVFDALEAANILEHDGVSAAVAVLAHLGQRPADALTELLGSYEVVVSVEEGYATGGLGALVAEAISTAGLRTRLLVRGVNEDFDGYSGSQSFMKARHALDAAALATASRSMLAGHNSR
jgi:transketolase